MKNNPIASILLICLILITSCNVKRVEGPARILKLTGINGIANYHISRSRGEVLAVIKDEYSRPAEYFIQIHKDTVMLGNDFIGSFYIIKPKFKISIEEPRAELIEGEFKMERPSDNDFKNFIFPTERLGTFTFKGQVECDSLVIPFEYKFIVISKK